MKRFLMRHWDFVIALLIAKEAWTYLPRYIALNFAKDVYAAGVGTLSIVFSIAFGAIVIITTLSDDFIRYLEEDGRYSALLKSFHFTLGILFASLVVSTSLFIFTAFRYYNDPTSKESSLWMCSFLLSLVYALLASRLIGTDVIRLSVSRGKFLCSGDE
jgi:hypothetical protein